MNSGKTDNTNQSASFRTDFSKFMQSAILFVKFADDSKLVRSSLVGYLVNENEHLVPHWTARYL